MIPQTSNRPVPSPFASHVFSQDTATLQEPCPSLPSGDIRGWFQGGGHRKTAVPGLKAYFERFTGLSWYLGLIRFVKENNWLCIFIRRVSGISLACPINHRPFYWHYPLSRKGICSRHTADSTTRAAQYFVCPGTVSRTITQSMPSKMCKSVRSSQLAMVVYLQGQTTRINLHRYQL